MNTGLLRQLIQLKESEYDELHQKMQTLKSLGEREPELAQNYFDVILGEAERTELLYDLFDHHSGNLNGLNVGDTVIFRPEGSEQWDEGAIDSIRCEITHDHCGYYYPKYTFNVMGVNDKVVYRDVVEIRDPEAGSIGVLNNVRTHDLNVLLDRVIKLDIGDQVMYGGDEATVEALRFTLHDEGYKEISESVCVSINEPIGVECFREL